MNDAAFILDFACGKTRSQIGDAQALYGKYEKWIRKNESRFDTSLGATGAIYAIKKELWSPLPESKIAMG